MRTVLENMNDGIALVDKDFRWQFGNEQFSRFSMCRPMSRGRARPATT